ncbi:hypothetical protein NliqN6_4560 [Naganishia liquefaciens]|uniref:Uncharacterized protein n=1 Tax=Naganishia liquefaciens TaxID=104408 RepID=A0A8H3TWJ8_9TREE|nr:hypothetical protein NliqN6_4560 [Naganishia liquefaciens]
MAGQFSPQEQTYFNRLFDVVDKEKLGVLPGDASITFLLTSKLPQRTLGEIWALCDPNNTGYLTRDGWWKACRLIGWAQKGETVREELMIKAGALPKFEGHDVPSVPAAMTPQLTGVGAAQPPLTPADKNQYTRLFVSANPVNGLLPATQAQSIFLKSGLPTETLAQIWNLADTQQRGSLDLPDFVLAMYFIQHTMAGTFKSLPPVLPAGLYEQASGGRPRPAALPTSPISRQMTGGGMVGGSPTPSLMARQMTGSGPMQPQRTGQSFTAAPQRQFSGSLFAPPQQQQQQGAWDIKPEEKQAADSFFDGLDTGRKGYIEGDVAVPFMLQSGLPEGTLAQIWDLADIRKEGKLNKDEFAVAMYLINKKLGGIEPPQTLPTSLIPPSLRSGVEAQQNQPSQTQRDLFDLFADSPPATTSATQQGQTQSQNYFASPLTATATGQGQGQHNDPRAQLPGGTESFGTPSFGTDLMGDDDTPAPAPAAQPRAPPSRSLSAIQPQSTGPKTPTRDYSADIGNAKNSLDSTTRAVHDLEKEKAELESKESSSAAQLKEIELRLSSVRAQHDNESRIVNDLKRRTQEQTETLAKLRSELIANESELSALRAEKDETEQALLRDKEEVRTMGKRMKEVQEETDKLKSLLEKMKKEARQQRGMVAIAKKQVQTVESGRDAVQKEMDEVAAGKGMEDLEEQSGGLSAATVISPQSTGMASPGNVVTAASIPLPATPQRALSPVATGNQSRSNNPFDRLGFGGSSFAKPPSPANNGASLFATAFGTQENVSAPVEASRDAPVTEEAHDESLSALEKATIGAGAALAAVGTVAGVAVAGVEKALGIDDDQDKSANEQPPAETIHEIAQNVKEDTTESQVESTQDENAQASAGDNINAKSPSSLAPGESEDPFDMPSKLERRDSDATPTAEAPSTSGDVNADPFGMPPTAATGGFVTATEKQPQSDFDDNFESDFAQGFGNDFSKGAAIGTEGAVGKNLANNGPFGTADSEFQPATTFDDDFASATPDTGFGQVTSPTADMHLAPASEPKNEFESALGNADKPVISAIPPQIRGLMAPNMPERTASTQAIASSSSVGTPLSEFAPSTPRTPYTEEADSENASPAPRTSATREEPEIDSDDDEAYGAPSAPPRDIEPESSDDEAEGPEDLDRSRSPFANQQNQQSMSASHESAAPVQPRENPVPALSNLGLGAPLAEDNERSAPIKESFEQTAQSQQAYSQSTPIQSVESSQAQQPSFDSFAQTTQPQTSETFSPAVQSAVAPASHAEKRRDPPPPPPARSPGQSQSSNPFASFAASSVPQPVEASSTATKQAPSASASSFDDDFDFENLPSAQVSHGQPSSQAETRQPTTNFDDEFDDFDNDFEQIRPAAQQPAIAPPVTTASAPSGGAPQLPGFDDNFGLSKPVAAARQTQGKTDNGFGFDDDFESAFTPVPHANQQQGGYAPPSGPPPAQSQSVRPDLPVRPSVNGSKAQPDDLEDVKKLCNMGFDRSLVVEALEANGYDFSKTLNVLLT